MEEYPDEALLSSGIAFHVGGCDKTGHPLVIFPTQYHAALASVADADLIVLLNYFRLIVPVQQKLNGFTYLINLQKSSQQVITKVITALNALQQMTNASVHSLYAIKPKVNKNLTHLEKLTGLKPSKKNPAKNLYQVHVLKDFASLHRSVDKAALSDEFSGHQQISIPAWAQFRTRVDGLTSDVSRCQSSLEEARDQMTIMCELEISADSEDTQTLLDKINAKHSHISRDLNLEHVIDNCSLVLEELNPAKAQVKYAQGDLLRDLVKHIRTSQRELTEAREHLQIQWRQAQARVVQASQLRGHQRNSNKISKWIDRNGVTTLSELSQPIKSLEQVTSFRQRTAELTNNFQELEKEAEYILTDVEYMALQDLSEFTQSFKSIELMKGELNGFKTNLTELDKRLCAANAVFSNAAKCYNWYCEFLTAVKPTSDPAEFVSECEECLKRLKESAPPKEWLGYIESKLMLIEDPLFSRNTTVLIERIRKISSMGSESEERDLSLAEVRDWKGSLNDGFDKLSDLVSVQTEEPQCQSFNGPSKSKKVQHSSHGSASATPKLRGGSSYVPDSSTDDVDRAEATHTRTKRPAKNKKTPTKNGGRRNKDSTQEAYIDLTETGVKVSQLPDSLSHVDLTKFLENEPEDTARASSTPFELNPANTHSSQLNTSNKKSSDDTFPASTTSRSDLTNGAKKKHKRRRRRNDDDDTDDSCPRSIDYLNSARGPALASLTGDAPLCPPAVPQNYQLPYNPVTQKERLERIYKSSSPSLEQKLDMMASLIEEGDESCFHVQLRESMSAGGTTDRRARTVEGRVKPEPKRIGRLTPANLSRELSADVTYPEHIYHWLTKQNDENFSSRENLTETVESESVKDCIERAEKILQDGIPTFPPASRADLISKSGDSGITELTARDTATLTSNGHHRYASRESGLDSEITGYTLTDNGSELYNNTRGSTDHSTNPSRYTGTRPKEVPPLWLKKPYSKANKRSRTHQSTNHNQRSSPEQ